jgi:hypothetical protein
MLPVWPFALACVEKRKRIAAGSKSGTKEDHNTHTEIWWQTKCWVSQTTAECFCGSTVHRTMGYSTLLLLHSLKKYQHARNNNIQRLSTTLRYVANGNIFEDLKFIRVTYQSSEIIVLEMCLQTLTEWLLSNRPTVHRLLNRSFSFAQY